MTLHDIRKALDQDNGLSDLFGEYTAAVEKLREAANIALAWVDDGTPDEVIEDSELLVRTSLRSALAALDAALKEEA